MDRMADDQEKRVAAIREAALCAARYIRVDNVPCQIKEGLYLGSLDAANNKTLLKSENVTHILTVAMGLTPVFPDGFIHKVIDVLDREDEDISPYFDECFDFIEEAIVMGEGVLVHCFAGRSRSATIIVAYLMKKYSMSLVDAVEYVRGKRPIACPNSGFTKLLQNYKKSLQAMNGKTDDQQKRIPAVRQASCTNRDVVPCQIEKGLYLGSLDAANNKPSLKSENVTHILTVANGMNDDQQKDRWQTMHVNRSIPCQIGEGLYLGSVDAANNNTLLKSKNVTHILTVANSLTPAYPNDFIYKTISVLDRREEDISQHFDECFNFIDRARGIGGGVLVHCLAGRSRSVTIIVAYLMKKYSMSLAKALEYVRKKRPIARPNSGFMISLQNYEKSLQATNGMTDDENVPCQIEKGLYLGSLAAARNKTKLKSENVTHILTVAWFSKHAYPNDFKYKTISVLDREDQDISQYFDECFNFFEEAERMGGGVSVHSSAGRSRSVTIIVAYLMKKYRMSMVKALEYVSGKQPIACPNSGFITLLQNYEKSLRYEESISKGTMMSAVKELEKGVVCEMKGVAGVTRKIECLDLASKENGVSVHLSSCTRGISNSSSRRNDMMEGTMMMTQHEGENVMGKARLGGSAAVEVSF